MSMPRMSSRMKRHARAMRRNPTRSEGRMWSWLRNRRFIGYKFRRQVPIGHYIVDFYRAELKLVIELDGTHHRSPGTDEYDDRRTTYLRRRGLHMLRIPNEQLIRDSEIVVEMIQAAIGQCLRSRENEPPHPPSAPFDSLRSLRAGSSPPAEKRWGRRALDGRALPRMKEGGPSSASKRN